MNEEDTKEEESETLKREVFKLKRKLELIEAEEEKSLPRAKKARRERHERLRKDLEIRRKVRTEDEERNSVRLEILRREQRARRRN